MNSPFGPGILKRILHDLLTAMDGETFAYGRAAGILVLIVGLVVWSGLTAWLAATLKASPGEWGGYLGGSGAYLLSLGGAVWGLVSGTAKTDLPPLPAAPSPQTSGAASP